MADLRAISLKVRNYKCFLAEAQGFESILPINLIIGRNNTGKSALLDIVGHVTTPNNLLPYRQRGEEPRLVLTTFPAPTGIEQMNRMTDDGQLTIDDPKNFKSALRSVRIQWTPNEEKIEDVYFVPSLRSYFRTDEVQSNMLDFLTRNNDRPFQGLQFRRLAPDRDIQPEKDDTNLDLAPNGTKATTLFQNFLNRDVWPSELVETTILAELNNIFAPEGKFTRIFTQMAGNGEWELYLQEEGKGKIRVADSGHGVKTILLILANLYLVPHIADRKLSDYLFGFEELENNMHPALLGRLLLYLRKKAVNDHCRIFLTSHSHIAIDLFAHDEQAQILHVTHNGEKATVRTVTKYIQHRQILDDLDVRASDLLQSNCVVWVEGPSDRLYFNRWIEIFSKGRLREGVNYQCAFYGGKLLAQVQATDPDEDTIDLVNLMRINKHAILLMDSDKSSLRSRVNLTKVNLISQLEEMGGFAWLTAGREIENYLPLDALQKNYPDRNLDALGLYEDIKDYLDRNVQQVPKRRTKANPEKKIQGTGKYFERDKVGFARLICPFLSESNLSNHLDVKEKMLRTCELIEKWNGVREEP